MGSDKAAIINFSTSDLPERDRLSFWRETFARRVVLAEIEADANLAFHAEATLFAWPGLRVIWGNSSPARMLRRAPLVADGDDSFAVLIRQHGSLTMAQRGDEVALGLGDAVGVLHAESATMQVAQTDWVGLSIPRAALAPFITNVEDRAMRLIPKDIEALRLLTKYLEILREDAALMTPELRHAVVIHIHDLIAMALGATDDGAETAKSRGIRAARLRVLRADILENLSNPELTVIAVALRQRVTPRYIHMLFEQEGITFSEYVLSQRLMLAHRMLTNSRFASLTITNIAFASGFGDLSHFNHTFRRRFGVTPSEVRHSFRSGRQ